MKFLTLVLLAAAVVSGLLHVQDNAVFYDGASDASKPSLEQMWDDLWPFQGINTFAHLDHHKCLLDPETTYDVALIGVPFDTAVSYRPGARFGPRAIRAASQRQTSLRGWNQRADYNPYQSWARVVDCGDIPVTPMDNSIAFKQMTMAFEELLVKRRSANDTSLPPRYVALGGDHSVLLPHLRALKEVYGPLNVIHFDAHLDTWKPDKYPSFWHLDQSETTHGSMLWKAWEEGLTTKHNVHAGLRTKLSGIEDYLDDDEQLFERVYADDVWLKGADYVVDKILSTVPKDTPTYLSVDIDVLDPGFGSGTGTQEPGGWLPRELIYVLRRLEELNVVGADIVEVSPAFDNAEITATNGAQVAFEIITSMVKRGFSGKVNPEAKVTEIESGVPESLTKKLEQKLQEVEEMKNRLTVEIETLRKMQQVVSPKKVAIDKQ